MYTGPENKYHVLEISMQTLQDIALLITTRHTECVRQIL